MPGKKLNAPSLVVAPEETAARQLYEDLRFFLGDRVYFFPRTDLLFYDVEAKGQDVTRERLRVLQALSAGGEACHGGDHG